MDTASERIEEVLHRLERIEAVLRQLLEDRTIKEWYTIAEVAKIMGNKSEYTVREWCRKGQIPAEKTANGRDWIVSHQTLLRLKNRELPLPEHLAHGAYSMVEANKVGVCDLSLRRNQQKTRSSPSRKADRTLLGLGQDSLTFFLMSEVLMGYLRWFRLYTVTIILVGLSTLAAPNVSYSQEIDECYAAASLCSSVAANALNQCTRGCDRNYDCIADCYYNYGNDAQSCSAISASCLTTD
jgi:hypothetical protein